VQRYPEQFMGFASVDPWKGKLAVQELERSVKELGLRGLKLHPTTQAFFPNDRSKRFTQITNIWHFLPASQSR
jgi:predicted TIM-barrel fold metal-dependent hydrolase